MDGLAGRAEWMGELAGRMGGRSARAECVGGVCGRSAWAGGLGGRTGWAGWVRTVAGMDQTLALNLSDLSQAATISNKISLVTGLEK